MSVERVGLFLPQGFSGRGEELVGRKGGRGGNGSSRRKPPRDGREIVLPEGLFLQLREMTADAAKILFWLFYKLARSPGVRYPVEEIAEAAGLSVHLAGILLRDLVREKFVSWTPDGFCVADLPFAEWDPPS